MDIIFLGCRGYLTKYGGWETFVRNLIKNWNDETTRFFVFGIVDKESEQGVFEVDGVTCINYFIKAKGGLKTVVADLKSLKNLKTIMKQFQITNPILYVMGARMGWYMWLRRRFFKKNHIHLIHNPAGLEWKRAKWNAFTKKYIYYSHVLLSKISELLICDSKGMVDVYNNILHNKVKTCYIPYGSYPVNLLEINKNEEAQTYCNENGITINEYYLMIGRFVPENNFELIFKEFMKTKTKRDLIVVCNHNTEKRYFDKLDKKIHFTSDSRIRFVGAVYNKTILDYLRANSFAYIHGHSVGGTNPSLLEALSTGNCFLVYDVCFNKYICENFALYFDSTSGSLSNLIRTIEASPDDYRLMHKNDAHNLISTKYMWSQIVDEYKKAFGSIYCKGLNDEE